MFAAWWPVSARKLVAFFGTHDVSQVDVQRQDAIATTVDSLDAKWVYDVQDRLWATETVRRADLEMYRIGADKDGALLKVSSTMAAWVPSLKRGYMIGGTSYRDSKDLYDGSADRLWDDHNGFLVYDLAADSWTNRSMPVPLTRDGVLAHISTRDDEVLVMFGGWKDRTRKPKEGPVLPHSPFSAHVYADKEVEQRSMREFDIYSTAKDKWYRFVGGEGARRVPDPRINMCHTVVAAPDGSSAQIIIYGGQVGTTTDVESTDSVWALTLPSFDWVQLSGNASDSSRLPGKRTYSACAGIGRGSRYMLSWGGLRIGNTGQTVCDANGNAAFLLDVSRGMWVDTFDPALEYQVPQEVVDVIGGSFVPSPASPPFSGHLRFRFADEWDSPSGGATKMQPDGGWRGDGELASVMRPKQDTSSPSGSSTLPEHMPSPPESRNRTGAIAGGVVGGLAVLAALAGLLFFLRRRRPPMAEPPSVFLPMDMGTAGAPLGQVHEMPAEPGPTGGGGVG